MKNKKNRGAPTERRQEKDRTVSAPSLGPLTNLYKACTGLARERYYERRRVERRAGEVRDVFFPRLAEPHDWRLQEEFSKVLGTAGAITGRKGIFREDDATRSDDDAKDWKTRRPVMDPPRYVDNIAKGSKVAQVTASTPRKRRAKRIETGTQDGEPVAIH